MPNYDYRCPACGHAYTKLQKFTDKSRAKCPECGARGERVISGGAGLIFKGSGFYATDYARKGDKTKDQEPAAAADQAKNGSAKKESPKEPSKTVKPKPKGSDS